MMMPMPRPSPTTSNPRPPTSRSARPPGPSHSTARAATTRWGTGTGAAAATRASAERRTATASASATGTATMVEATASHNVNRSAPRNPVSPTTSRQAAVLRLPPSIDPGCRDVQAAPTSAPTNRTSTIAIAGTAPIGSPEADAARVCVAVCSPGSGEG
jgi:hypothetical protein